MSTFDDDLAAALEAMFDAMDDIAADVDHATDAGWSAITADADAERVVIMGRMGDALGDAVSAGLS